jgi:6-pyruvoyltetrahydropterin/6-carboxytetrahydropterin synthase
MISITRVYRFSASHRLHSPLLSESENVSVFGKCNNPFGHGHDYVLSVTVTGKLDERTGLLVPIGELDHLVTERVLHRFSHRNMNLDVPQFADVVPTTEKVALLIATLLQDGWSSYLGHTGALLRRVHIQETERNGFEVVMPVIPTKEEFRLESEPIHA